ncbi:hypothetical protein ODJ79_32000 [Actinoplanes sp. KI2]|uniref:hypothetical protein n=1 Tax=Actinoplanes sp. KI2 TaxID=2983315 RepID=UPI0021D5D66D|nr:hypothetical protein [Actinoplanes sp. KI2]MCU7728359.1 hypothetical protein [Actinoplanes sp. KI2]
MRGSVRTRGALLAAIATAAALILTPSPAHADPGRDGSACPEVRLTADLPAPPLGATVRQSVTIGDDCAAHLGPVEVVPAARTAARSLAAGAAPRTFHSFSQMYDCCNILMTALYSDHTWSTGDGLVQAADSRVSTHVNREPWDAGWTVRESTGSGGCTGACPAATFTAHADFTYRGIFDVTGTWYANTHDSSVVLAGDGTATCRHTVDLRHTFIGWHWEHGCS